jgi:hypothetical protein
MLAANSFAAFYVEGGILLAGNPRSGFQKVADGISYAKRLNKSLIAAYKEHPLEERREVVFFKAGFDGDAQEVLRTELALDDEVINEDHGVYVLRRKLSRLERLELDLDGWTLNSVAEFEWSGAEPPWGIIAQPSGRFIGAWRVDRVEIRTPWARLTMNGAGYIRFVDESVLVEADSKTTIVPTRNAQSYTTRVCRWQFVHELKCNDWLVYDPRRGMIKQVAPHTGATRKGGVHNVGKSAVFFRNTPIVIAEDGYAYDYTEGVAAKRRLLRVPLSCRHEVFFDYGVRPYAWDIAYVEKDALCTMRRGVIWRAPEGREIGKWCIGEYGGFAAIMHYTPTFVVKDMCLTTAADRQYELVAL